MMREERRGEERRVTPSGGQAGLAEERGETRNDIGDYWRFLCFLFFIFFFLFFGRSIVSVRCARRYSMISL